MISKRSILKGITGAAVLASGKNANTKRPPRPYPPAGGHDEERCTRSLNECQPPSADPLWEVKNAFRRHANEQAELENKAIDRRIRALQRLQSVSQSFIDYQIDCLNNHRAQMWNRLNQLMQSI